MIFEVVHSTRYRYSRPVALEPHLMRLRPREDATQRLQSFVMTIDPEPAGLSDLLDEDGNSAVSAWFSGDTEALTIRTAFRVETRRANPFDYLPTGGGLGPVEGTGAAGRLARDVARDGGDALAFLTALNARIYEGMRHTERPSGPPFTPEQALDAGEGSCRDLAVLFMACCEAAGLRARFVSGYEQAAAEHHSAYMHAWAEVYLPGAGWRGFDPSRGLAVADRHVAIAASRDPASATPVAGSFRGSAEAQMDVSITLRVEA